ncbi:hypothetical protein CHISP_0446 [Chitinispirillum alkaliphilum]|nr:hypothetical protein CHISP_0446 [Chitinispirillum alkaliphilum]
MRCKRLILLFPLIFLCFCGESEEAVRKKLDIILEDDLEAILDGVDPVGILENPYYEITLYQTYDEGRYTARAEVDFYFLKDVKARIVRKYRYHKPHRMWDRYYNKYEFYSESSKNENN